MSYCTMRDVNFKSAANVSGESGMIPEGLALGHCGGRALTLATQ